MSFANKNIDAFYMPNLLSICFLSGSEVIKSKNKMLEFFKDGDNRAILMHEYVHFVQSISSTYNIHVLFEVLDNIYEALKILGGDYNNVLRTGMYKSKNFSEHFFTHKNCFEADYPSYEVKIDLGKTDAGISLLNPHTYCYDYIRWNNIENKYFATPLGAKAFNECIAYINEKFFRQMITNPKYLSIDYDNDAPITDEIHFYKAPLELFFKTFKSFSSVEIQKYKILTLELILDISLQYPITDELKKDGDFYYSPSMIFTKLVDCIREEDFKELLENENYYEFIDKITQRTELLSPMRIWESTYKLVDNFLRQNDSHAKELIKSSPKVLEDAVMFYAQEFLFLGYSEDKLNFTDERYNEIMERFRYKLEEDSYLINRNFGFGLLSFIKKALEIRTNNPEVISFLHSHLSYVYDAFELPVININGYGMALANEDNFFFLRDLMELKHLWAIAQQVNRNSYETLCCAYKLFNWNCHNKINGAECFVWSKGKRVEKVNCEFTSLIKKYRI